MKMAKKVQLSNKRLNSVTSFVQKLIKRKITVKSGKRILIRKNFIRKICGKKFYLTQSTKFIKQITIFD